MGSGSGGSTSKDAGPGAASDVKAEPLVGGKPKEGTPLLGGSSKLTTADDVEKTPKEKMQTILAIVALVGIAVIKTQLTASLFSHAPQPTAYGLWTCVVTCLLLVPFFLLVPGSFAVPKREMVYVLSLIVFFTALDLGATNIALSLISTALQQCIASTNPFWSIFIETAIYKKWQHWLVYLTVGTLCVGAALAALGSDITRISTFGVASAVVAVVSSASKGAFTHKAFQAFKKDLGPLALLFWVDLLMIPFYLIPAIINGELVALTEHALSDGGFFGVMTFIAALGGVRALTQFVVLLFVSATSMSTANLTTQQLNILVSFTPINTGPHPPVTGLLISGIAITLSVSSFYAYIKAHRPFLAKVDEVLPACAPKKEAESDKKPPTAA